MGFSVLLLHSTILQTNKNPNQVKIKKNPNTQKPKQNPHLPLYPTFQKFTEKFTEISKEISTKFCRNN